MGWRLNPACPWVAIVVVSLTSLASADTITVSAPTIFLNPSNSQQTGYFDITLSVAASGNTNESAGGGLDTNGTEVVNGFNVEVQTTFPLLFTNSDDQTQAGNPAGGPATYVFAPSDSSDDPSFDGSNTSWGSGAPFGTYPTNNVLLFDFASGAGVTVTAGEEVGLLRVEYTIPANFDGDLGLFFPLDVSANWNDANSDIANPLTVNGAIIMFANPEPSSVSLAAIALAGLIAFGVRRR